MSLQGLVSVAAVVVSVAAQVVSAAAAVVVASAVNPGGTAGTAAGERLGRDQQPWQLAGQLLGHMETGSPFHKVVGSSPLFGPL